MRTGADARIAFLIYDNQTFSLLDLPTNQQGLLSNGRPVNDFAFAHKEANTMVPWCVLHTRQLFHPGRPVKPCTSPCITRLE